MRRFGWLVFLGLWACSGDPVALLDVEGVSPSDVEVGSQLEIAGRGFPVTLVGDVRFVGTVTRGERSKHVDVRTQARALDDASMTFVADERFVAAMQGDFEGRVEVEFDSQFDERVRGSADRVRLHVVRDDGGAQSNASSFTLTPSLIITLCALVIWLTLLAFITPLGRAMQAALDRASQTRIVLAQQLRSPSRNAHVMYAASFVLALVIVLAPRVDVIAGAVGVLMTSVLGQGAHRGLRAGGAMLSHALGAVLPLAALALLCGQTTLSVSESAGTLLGPLPAALISPVHMLATWIALESAASIDEQHAWIRALRRGAAAALIAPMLAPHMMGAVGLLAGAALSWTLVQVLACAPWRARSVWMAACVAGAASIGWVAADAAPSRVWLGASVALIAWLGAMPPLWSVVNRRRARAVTGRMAVAQ